METLDRYGCGLVGVGDLSPGVIALRAVRCTFLVSTALLLSAGSPLFAQNPLDQASPEAITRDLPKRPDPTIKPARPTIEVGAPLVPVADAGKAGILIGAIRVQGAQTISVGTYSAAIEPFIGLRLTNADFAKLSKAVADIARKNGLVFATAWVPPQSLEMGVLTVRIDEGQVSEVRLSGSSNTQVKRVLAKLRGHAAHVDELEAQIFLVSEIPGITLQKIRFVRESGKGVLLVDAVEDRVSAQASVDTLGSDTVGPVRAILSVDFNSLLNHGDVLTFQGVATPVQAGELYYGYARYAVPFGGRGTTIALRGGAGFTKPGGNLSGLDVTGRSIEVGADLSHPLLRSKNANATIVASVNALAVRQKLAGFQFSRDRVTTASLTLAADTALFGGRLRETITATRGLGLIHATGFGDPLASREDASGRFSLLNAYVDWTGTLVGPVSLKLAGSGQIASRALLAVSEMGLGGNRFGRAYGYSERSGDEGVAGSAELRTDFNKPLPLLEWVQLYAFADGGVVRNFDQGFGGGRLYSGGGGVRARLGKFGLGFETAFPLNSDRFDSGDRSPRLNMQLSLGL